MSHFNVQRLALASAVAGLFLAGCGSGGGGGSASTTLSGTVAGGAAVIGNVIVTDSKGATKSAAIEANGKYTIDVTGMTGPFVLKAAGTVGNTTVTYYSAATTADVGGTVNVTPFTNLIVSNIAAQLAETYFSNPANLANLGTLITPTTLAAAETALQAKLAPVLSALGIDSSIDLLRSSFATNHAGMDAVLDLVKVEVDTATNITTLKNALTQTVIATDNAASSADDATPVDSTNIAGINTTTATDLQVVVSKLDSFAALFASSLPTVAQLESSGVFDTSANFMMGGQSFAQFATELTTQQSAIGLKFTNVAISLDASGTAGSLTAIVSSNTAGFSQKIELKMVKVSGVWKVQGDGRIANVELVARAERNEWVNYNLSGTMVGSGSWMQSGIHIWIDPFAYNASHSTAQVATALITGPGLGGGVTMVPDVQNRWMKLEGATYNSNVATECGVAVNGQAAPTTQCVNIAQALDNSEYNVLLKDGSGASLNGAGYKLILPKQPYATSALVATMFPTITSITVDGQALTPSMMGMMANKTVGIGWTLPSGLVPRHANIWASTNTGASYFNVEKELLPTATSVLMGLGSPMSTGTVNNAGVWLEGRDVFGRSIAISQSMSIQ